MSNWKYSIRMKDSMEMCREGEITVKELALQFKESLEPILKNLPEEYTDELQSIIEEFETVEDTEEFDCVLNQLFDFGDIDLSSDKQPNTKMMWVGTAF